MLDSVIYDIKIAEKIEDYSCKHHGFLSKDLRA